MAKEKISEQARIKLKKIHLDSLRALDAIRKDLKLSDGITDVVRGMIDEERDLLIRLNSADPDLSVKHADGKGRVGGVTLLIHMIKGSGDELERREEN